MTLHKVEQGDCMESIAAKYGHFWETIWLHPDNGDLRRVRKDPNLLSPGDRVFVPDSKQTQVTAATETRHRFRRKGVPSTLRVALLKGGKERAGESYVLDVDKQLFTGHTDAEGEIVCTIPPDARQAKLQLTDSHEEYTLDLGHLDPPEMDTGCQARLKNLGYYHGDIDGVVGSKTRTAIAEFRKTFDMSPSDQLDSETRDKLEQVYGA